MFRLAEHVGIEQVELDSRICVFMFVFCFCILCSYQFVVTPLKVCMFSLPALPEANASGMYH